MVPSLFPKDLRHNFLALLPDQFQFSEVGFKNGIVDNKIRNKDEFLLNFEHIREVSPNTSDSFCTIIFDVDLKWNDDVKNDVDDVSEYAPDEEQLLNWNIEHGLIPEPTWVTVNPISKHYHVVYLFNRFYLKKYESYVRKYQKIYNYLAPILGADKGYNGLSTHNPLHNVFFKPIVNNRTYALDELLDFVVDSELNIDNEKIVQERRISDNRISATGKDYRNNTIFMRLMYFAKHYPDQDLWELAKMWRDDYAAKFPNKPYITGSQLRATVLSVKKYQNDGKLFINQLVDLYDENIVVERKSDFTEKQAERGRKSGAVRNEQRQKKIVEMENLIRLGKNKTEIKHELGISERTYQTYLKQLKTKSMQ